MFWPFKRQKKTDKAALPETPLKQLIVVVSGSDRNISSSAKSVIQNSLKSFSIFNLINEEETIIENFSNPDNKNFFDFWDSGQKILKKQQADILVRVYTEKNNICLNFQTPDLYTTTEPPFFSLLNTIYLPNAYFQKEYLPDQISVLIASTLLAFTFKKDERYLSYLRRLIEVLSKNRIPNGIPSQFLPHILNLLILDYIAAKGAHFERKDFKLALNLIDFAFQNIKGSDNVPMKGALFNTLGEIYQCSLSNKNADSYILLQRTIESYKKAQKYFNRYIFPYDYGRLSLILGELYFQFFKLSDDSQTLRDAIFHLREAEKIFTMAGFPFLWAHTQENLGIYLSLLSARSDNKEIAMMAVQNFKNEQLVFEKKTQTEKWADIETQIADIYYHLGKRLLDKVYLDKALDYYDSALEVFENLQKTDKLKQIEICIQKTDEEIIRSN